MRSVVASDPGNISPELDTAIKLLAKRVSAKPELPTTTKNILRALPVALGLLSGVLGVAPAFGNGSHPVLVGGFASGLTAAVFGGSLMSFVRSKLPTPKRAKQEE